MKIVWYLVTMLLLYEDAAYLTEISRNIKKITDSAVWDIDKARDSYVNNSKYMYQQGCLQGSSWQEEQETLRKSSKADYQVDNIYNYCVSHYSGSWIEEGVGRDLYNLGRKKYGEPE